MMPPFFDNISTYNYEVLQLMVAKWRQISESNIPNYIEPDSKLEKDITTVFLQLQKTENFLKFLVNYKVLFTFFSIPELVLHYPN